MPTVLSVLKVEEEAWREGGREEGMDWGMLAVYSCVDSCQEGREEGVLVQPPGEEGGRGGKNKEESLRPMA